MKTTINEFDESTQVVSVTFEEGEIVHTRGVNAVMVDGKYDEAATAERIEEVARGVAHKIAAGVIKPQVAEEAPEETKEDSE